MPKTQSQETIEAPDTGERGPSESRRAAAIEAAYILEALRGVDPDGSRSS